MNVLIVVVIVFVNNVWTVGSAAHVVRMRSLLRMPSTIGVAPIWTYASSVFPATMIFNASRVWGILLQICRRNWHVVCARGALVVATFSLLRMRAYAPVHNDWDQNLVLTADGVTEIIYAFVVVYCVVEVSRCAFNAHRRTIYES